jgi:tRNA A37 threonylcarbamoyladenosine dehydratase
MRMHPFHRTELLVGSEGFERLCAADVCVIGLGGVGSYAAEALARSSVGRITLVDFDRVCVTNVNRQLHATRDTVGESKAALMGERVRAIHPKAEVRVMEAFYGPDTAEQILDRPYDAVLDCIDNMTAKLHLLETAVGRGLPVWSAMGAGGRMDPTRVRVSDLSETHTDPFARIVRQGLRERGIEEGVAAVWTDEPPNDLDAAVQSGFRCICPDKANSPNSCDRRLQVQGSVAWMPPIFGMVMAGAVANALLGRELRAVQPVGKPRQQPARNKLGRARQRELMAAAGLLELQPRSRRQLDDDGA